MKHKTLTLVIVIMLCIAGTALASFPVKYPASNSVTITGGMTPVSSAGSMVHRPSRLAARLAKVTSSAVQLFPERSRNDTVGLLSLIFGIVGLMPVYGIPFCITAIIMGSIGRRNDEKYANAGFTLGIVGAAIDVACIILAIVLLVALSAI